MFGHSLLPRARRPVEVAVLAFVVATMSAVPSVAAQDSGGGPQSLEDAAQLQAAQLDSSDARQLRVSDAVPEFGGVFRDIDGTLTVYLKNPAQKDRVRAAIEASFGAEMLGKKDLKVLQGRYGFAELSLYRQMVQPAFGLKGVSWTDVDEANNRVTVAVETRSDVARLELDLQRFGVPSDAIHVQVGGRVQMSYTLRSSLRPVAGGLQIAFSNYVCTMGFVATRAGVRGFVTNSHCTGQMGGVTSTVYYQAARPYRIGVETADPLWRSGGSCPAGRQCRYSDSAFVRLDSSASSIRGRIARTTGYRSLTISSASQTLRIAGETGYPFMGDLLSKIGRTTGWTWGRVVGTCLTVAIYGTNKTLLCQDAVYAVSAGGDSGSPVFKAVANPDRIRLYGILWGSNGSAFFFSRFSNIQRELGTLTTCDPALAGC